MLNNPCCCDSQKPHRSVSIKLRLITNTNRDKRVSSPLPSLLSLNFPAVVELPSKKGGCEVRYKMSHSSEQRPETSNSQLNRITLSSLTDRAVDRFVVRRGAGVVGARTERRFCENRSWMMGRVEGGGGCPNLPRMKETIHRGTSLSRFLYFNNKSEHEFKVVEIPTNFFILWQKQGLNSPLIDLSRWYPDVSPAVLAWPQGSVFVKK